MLQNYPEIANVEGVRYLPTSVTRDFMRCVKRDETEKVLGVIGEFRGEFLSNTRLRKRVVKEQSVMSRLEKMQRDIVKMGRNVPGLKWGSLKVTQQMDMDLSMSVSSGAKSSSTKYIVPASQLNQPSTYCHWLHYVLEHGSEHMCLAILEELSSVAHRKNLLVDLLLNSSAQTKPVCPFLYALWTCKSLRVVKRLFLLIGEDRLEEEFPSVDSIDSPTKKPHRDCLNMHLNKAIGSKNSGLVKLLLRFGADVLAYVNEVQATPLNYACRKNRPQMALILVQNGADVNQVMDMTINAINYRPLHYAVQENAKELVRALVDRGAPLDVVATFESNIDMTPLALAVQNDNYHTVEYLLAKGASPNAPAESKIAAIPVHLAIQNGNEDILQLLISHNASVVDALDTKGRNVLHHASMENNVAIARTLLEVDQIREELINAPDYSGYAPLHYASQHEDMAVARELIASDKSGRITSTVRTEVHKDQMGLTPMSPAIVEEAATPPKRNSQRRSSPSPKPVHRGTPVKTRQSASKVHHSGGARHPSQKIYAETVSSAGNIHLLRERVAMLKKKISDIQVQHAAEVHTLESQVHNMKSIAKTHHKQHAKLLKKVKSPQVGGSGSRSSTPSNATKRSPSVRRSLSQPRSSTPSRSVGRPSTAHTPSSTASRRTSSSSTQKRPTSSYSPSPAKGTSMRTSSRSSTISPANTSSATTPQPAATRSSNRKPAFKNVKAKVDSHRHTGSRQSTPTRSLSPLVRHTGSAGGASRNVSPARASTRQALSPSQTRRITRTLAASQNSPQVRHRSPAHKSPARSVKARANGPDAGYALNRKKRAPEPRGSPQNSLTPTKGLSPQRLFSPASSSTTPPSAAKTMATTRDIPTSKFGTLTRINKSTFEWAIPRSVAVRKSFQEAILSKKFHCFGQTWRLKMYPRGAVDDGMVSFYIMHDSGDCDAYNFTLDYSVEMINTVVPQEEDFRARNTFRKGEVSWGWAHYCASNEVLDVDRGFIDESGHILVHISFTNMSVTAIEQLSYSTHQHREESSEKTYEEQILVHSPLRSPDGSLNQSALSTDQETEAYPVG